MMSLFRATARKTACVTGTPAQNVGAALKGLCTCKLSSRANWAAEPLEGGQVDSQTIRPANEKPAQQTSRQVLAKPPVACLAVQDVQCSLKPSWPGSQQQGRSEGQLEKPQQMRFHTTFGDSTKGCKVNHRGPERTHNDRTASAQAGVQQASRKVSRILKMVHPAQVSAYIKEQQRMALAGVRGRQPTKALLVFYASMENLCSVARPLLDYISLSAIITATAKLWTSAQANSSFKPNADMLDFEMKHLYCSILLQLKPMLPDAKAQAVSNILWSSAKIRLNPDALVPGMTDALAAKVLQLTREDVRRQPNAQDCAIFLWALATLGHDPSDQSLTDAVCDHFAMLIKHHDESKRPSAQNCANFMWAVATLGHEPADQSLADAVCDRFAMLIKHSDESKRPNAGGAANVMWALGRMKHAPADGVASAILERLTTLCDLPGLTGRATFRQKLLAKHGKLVLISRHELSRSSLDDLAAYLQQEIEAAVGGSLVPYHC
ncbi:TPA: hypothetical protein ACH3X3_009452 [Trebouxia sp. C0006]